MLFKSMGIGVALSIVAVAPTSAYAQRHEARKEHRDDKRKNSLIGAGIGLLGGAILSGGDLWATVGGAAAGGLVGNVTTKDRRNDRRDDRRLIEDRRRWEEHQRRNRRR